MAGKLSVFTSGIMADMLMYDDYDPKKHYGFFISSVEYGMFEREAMAFMARWGIKKIELLEKTQCGDPGGEPIIHVQK